MQLSKTFQSSQWGKQLKRGKETKIKLKKNKKKTIPLLCDGVVWYIPAVTQWGAWPADRSIFLRAYNDQRENKNETLFNHQVRRGKFQFLMEHGRKWEKFDHCNELTSTKSASTDWRSTAAATWWLRYRWSSSNSRRRWLKRSTCSRR